MEFFSGTILIIIIVATCLGIIGKVSNDSGRATKIEKKIDE